MKFLTTFESLLNSLTMRLPSTVNIKGITYVFKHELVKLLLTQYQYFWFALHEVEMFRVERGLHKKHNHISIV